MSLSYTIALDNMSDAYVERIDDDVRCARLSRSRELLRGASAR